MALLRAVQPTETLKMAVGEIYNIQSVLNDFQKVEAEQLRNALSAAGPKDNLKKILNIKFGKRLRLPFFLKKNEEILCNLYLQSMVLL